MKVQHNIASEPVEVGGSAPPDRVPDGPPRGAHDGPAPGAPDDEERPATGRTRDRASVREWRDGMLLINLLPSQIENGNMAVVDDWSEVRDYETGELLARWTRVTEEDRG